MLITIYYCERSYREFEESLICSLFALSLKGIGFKSCSVASKCSESSFDDGNHWLVAYCWNLGAKSHGE